MHVPVMIAGHRKSCKKPVGFAVLFFTITFISIAWILCTVLFTTLVPSKKLHIPGDRMLVNDNSTIPLVSNVNLLWSLVLTFLDDDCSSTPDSEVISAYTPKVLFIPDVSCSNLSVVTATFSSSIDSREYRYALPGSQIHITVPENYTPHIWIITKEFEKDWRDSNEQYKCEDHQYTCFAVNSTGADIFFPITEPGYYNHFYLYSDDNLDNKMKSIFKYVNWTYEIYEYDNSTIMKDYGNLYPPKSLNDKTHTIFLQVANAFKFHRSSCILLNLGNCSIHNSFSCVRISVSYRWDVVLLIFMVYLVCVVFSVGSIVLGYNAVLKIRGWKKRPTVTPMN